MGASAACLFERRKLNSDAIRDLALSNFLEMRDHAASKVFRLKKKGERLLHRLLPQWYLPLYHMVSFSRIPYAQAVQKAKRQDRVVAATLLVLMFILLVLLGWWLT